MSAGRNTVTAAMPRGIHPPSVTCGVKPENRYIFKGTGVDIWVSRRKGWPFNYKVL